MEKFDVCVIGAGPSGFAAAMRAIDFGKRVALIERDKAGGAGLFDGALSSKTLWELSESYQLTRQTDLGYTVYDSELSFSSVMNQAHRAAVEKHKQMKQQINHFQKTGQLTYFQGHGKFLSKTEVEITAEHGDKKARRGLLETLDMAQHFVHPHRDFVAEGRGHGVLAMGAEAVRESLDRLPAGCTPGAAER